MVEEANRRSLPQHLDKVEDLPLLEHCGTMLSNLGRTAEQLSDQDQGSSTDWRICVCRYHSSHAIQDCRRRFDHRPCDKPDQPTVPNFQRQYGVLTQGKLALVGDLECRLRKDEVRARYLQSSRAKFGSDCAEWKAGLDGFEEQSGLANRKELAWMDSQLASLGFLSDWR